MAFDRDDWEKGACHVPIWLQQRLHIATVDLHRHAGNIGRGGRGEEDGMVRPPEKK
jgi:hypothetical protein